MDLEKFRKAQVRTSEKMVLDNLKLLGLYEEDSESETCRHQYYDTGERVWPAGPDVSAVPFNFCPWCGKKIGGTDATGE